MIAGSHLEVVGEVEGFAGDTVVDVPFGAVVVPRHAFGELGGNPMTEEVLVTAYDVGHHGV